MEGKPVQRNDLKFLLRLDPVLDTLWTIFLLESELATSLFPSKPSSQYVFSNLSIATKWNCNPKCKRSGSKWSGYLIHMLLTLLASHPREWRPIDFHPMIYVLSNNILDNNWIPYMLKLHQMKLLLVLSSRFSLARNSKNYLPNISI